MTTKITIPYGRQSIDAGDVQSVVEVLRSDWLTTGPKVERLEHVFSNFVGSKYSVAVSNGTAALHCAMAAIGIGSGDEVIIPAITFVATANSVVFQSGTPVFADVENDTLLIDVKDVEKKITPRTKAIIAVDYAGQPADYSRLQALASQYKLPIIADACHAIGGSYKGKPVGALADLSTFSFHPVKNITTGEGGMITTNNDSTAEMARKLINHGQEGTYNHVIIGNNYRLGEMQCAIGIEQLKKLDYFTKRRRKIAKMYSDLLGPGIVLPEEKNYAKHAYHLYVIRCNSHKRSSLMNFMKEKNVQCGIHYPRACHQQKAVPKHYCNESLPVTEKIVKEIVSLPIYPLLSDDDVEMIASSMTKGINTV